MGNDVLSLAAGIPVDSGGLLGNFGGPTDLGLSLLANAGPSPVRQPFGAILGRGALEARQNAIQTALQRAQLQQLQQHLTFGNMALGMSFPGQGAQGVGAPQAPSVPQAVTQNSPQGAPPATPIAGQFSGAPASGSQGVPQPQARNPYDPITQEDISQIQLPGVMPLNRQIGFALYNGKDPSPVIDAYRKQQIEAAKQTNAASVARLDSLIRSDHPASYARSDQAFMDRWPQLAQSMGVDPKDMKNGFTDPNVRRALGMLRNPLAASVGIPEIEVPETPTKGLYGSQYDQYGKEVTPPKPPSVSVEKSTDTHGKVTGIPVVTGGLNAAGTSAAVGSGGGKGGGVDLGYAPMTEENIKMAGFASISGPALDKVRTLETRGVKLSAQDRTLLLTAVTDDSQGVTGALQKYFSQLALTKMDPDKQTYITAMLPFLQGTAHLLAGARLPVNAIRADLESVVPLDINNKESMGVVNTTRQSYLNAMDVGSGSAGSAPEFKSTIGARRDTAIANANLPKLTPQQVADPKVPRGTRFLAADGSGRVLVKQ